MSYCRMAFETNLWPCCFRCLHVALGGIEKNFKIGVLRETAYTTGSDAVPVSLSSTRVIRLVVSTGGTHVLRTENENILHYFYLRAERPVVLVDTRYLVCHAGVQKAYNDQQR